MPTSKPIFLLLLLLCTASRICTQEVTAKGHLRMVFYNVENAFDCRHDTLYDDLTFLPESPRRWSPYRYHQKLRHLAQVIASLSTADGLPPAIVGLAEVENDSVLHDLTQRSPLRAAGYRYVMTHNTPATDPRGIDVALLYRPTHFRLINWSEHPIATKVRGNGGSRKTASKVIHHPFLKRSEKGSSLRARNLLLATGELLSGDTLDVIVCHWPSKLGGKRLSGTRREMAAVATATLVDSLRGVRARASIVVMGDMNDTPYSTVFTALSRHALTNLTQDCKGTYRYKGRWEQLDQLFVSAQLLPSNAGAFPPSNLESSLLHVVDAGVFREPFLLEREPVYGGVRPFRTWHGFRHVGGYSDHLPIYLDLEYNE